MTQIYAFHCRDGENGARLRELRLGDHLAYIEAHIEDYAVAGPLRRGGETIGSLLVIKAASEEVARARFEGDPYYVAGVWQSIRVDEFKGVAGDWVGGAAWKR